MNALNQLQTLGLELTVIPPLFPSPDSECVIGETFSSLAGHRAAISEIQRFRGRVYVTDGAIPAGALDEEGRHYQEFDFENYHLCLRDLRRQIRGCLRLRLHEPAVQVRDLRLSEVIERMPAELAELSHRAVTSLFALSQREGIRVGEVGGWAVDEGLRNSRVSVLLPVGCWAVYPLLAHVLAVASTTSRHQSSAILKRIGGFPLVNAGKELPRFMDDYHGCEMELLGFDSRKPDPKYEKIVADLKGFLLTKVHGPSTRQCARQIENRWAPNSDRREAEPAYA